MKAVAPLLWTALAAQAAVVAPAVAAAAATPTAAAPASPDELLRRGCFDIPGAACLRTAGGAGFIFGPESVPSDLLVWYRFDKSLPVDESGQGNHLVDPDGELSPLVVGPGILGRGGSAAFDGRAYRALQPTPTLEAQAFSVALWLYLREDSAGSWRTIFKKGEGAEELMPALLLWPDERRLQVRASPSADAVSAVVNSAGLLPLRRWTHIAVSCSVGGVLRLYINGAKDGEVIVESPRVVGGGELYLGRDPWHAGIKAYLDDFRWYSRALSADEIRALTYPSLTGMDADFVHLGCLACPFTEAVRSCGGRTHLCSLQELFSGGFHTARAMGWLAASPEVWFHGEEGDGSSSDVRKLGLCCAG